MMGLYYAHIHLRRVLPITGDSSWTELAEGEQVGKVIPTPRVASYWSVILGMSLSESLL
jgi:hypothetical protein